MNEAAAGLLSTAQLRDLEAALRASRSWRFTAGLRRLTQGSAFMSR
jgi:hypothetical protein